MNRKTILIILINILLLFIIFILVEVLCYKSIFVSGVSSLPDYKKFNKVKKEYIVDNHLYTNYENPNKSNRLIFENDGRSLVGTNYKKRPILLLGCSYTYGMGLKKEETFGYQLSEYTRRPVLNWGWETEGADYSFLQLKQKENINKLIKNPPEYIIFTYMYDHLDRLINKSRQYRWFYLRKYGLIKNQHYQYIDNLYSVLAFKNKLFSNYLMQGDKYENLLDFDIDIIRAMKKEVEKYSPDSKFIVLIYMVSYDVLKQNNKAVPFKEYDTLNSPKWKALEKEGFTVITTEELLGRKMDKKSDILQNDNTLTVHPTAEAWHQITIKLAKKLASKYPDYTNQ